MVVAVSAVLPTVLCYQAVKRYFKEFPSSDEVKRMQTKLSHGFLLQVSIEQSLTLNFPPAVDPRYFKVKSLRHRRHLRIHSDIARV